MVVLVPALVAAQPQRESERLFAEGRELARQGNHEEACKRFARSFMLDRAPGTALNYGDCLEHLGHNRRAWQLFSEAATAFERSGDARVTFARQRADAAAAKLGTVVLRIAEPGTPGLLVQIGDSLLTPVPELTHRVDAGDVVIIARAPGRRTTVMRARLGRGAEVTLELPPLVVEDATPVASRPVPPPTEPTMRAGRTIEA